MQTAAGSGRTSIVTAPLSALAMMEEMRIFFSSLLLAGFLSAAVTMPELEAVKKVYLLPMTNGLDQFVANELTRGGRFTVVTDPSLADTIMTDRLGDTFEKKFSELYPSPDAPKEVKKDKDGKEIKESTRAREEPPVRLGGGFGRSKGTVFLVQRTNKKVLWSYYMKPKSARSEDQNYLAKKIVNRLMTDIKLAAPKP